MQATALTDWMSLQRSPDTIAGFNGAPLCDKLGERRERGNEMIMKGDSIVFIRVLPCGLSALAVM